MELKPFEIHVNSKYGAPMGRHSDMPHHFEGREIRILKVPFFDGDYDKGGAYWGCGTPLYCIFTIDADEPLVCYKRATNRQEVIAMMQDIGALL